MATAVPDPARRVSVRVGVAFQLTMGGVHEVAASPQGVDVTLHLAMGVAPPFMSAANRVDVPAQISLGIQLKFPAHAQTINGFAVARVWMPLKAVKRRYTAVNTQTAGPCATVMSFTGLSLPAQPDSEATFQYPFRHQRWRVIQGVVVLFRVSLRIHRFHQQTSVVVMVLNPHSLLGLTVFQVPTLVSVTSPPVRQLTDLAQAALPVMCRGPYARAHPDNLNLPMTITLHLHVVARLRHHRGQQGHIGGA